MSSVHFQDSIFTLHFSIATSTSFTCYYFPMLQIAFPPTHSQSCQTSPPRSCHSLLVAGTSGSSKCPAGSTLSAGGVISLAEFQSPPPPLLETYVGLPGFNGRMLWSMLQAL